MGEQGVEDGAKDASLWSADVCDNADWSPVSNPDRLEPVTDVGVQTICRQFVGVYVGFDCVEGGALIHKEPPDVGVLIFQVEEGIVENSSD